MTKLPHPSKIDTEKSSSPQNNKQHTFKVVATFIVVAILLYFGAWWLIFKIGKATPLMMSVGVAALFTCFIWKIPVASLGWQWGKSSYQWASYLIPLCYAFLAYIIIWTVGFGDFYNAGFVSELTEQYQFETDFAAIVMYGLITATISFALLLPSVLGEEFAWRGFLHTELAKTFSFSQVTVITGVLWSLFHYPLIIFGLYGADGPTLLFQLTTFTIFIMSISTIMTYLRYRSGSLWTAVIFHMSSNIFIQKFFTPMTQMNESSAWYVDEFGIVLTVICLSFAIFFFLKGRAIGHSET